MTLPWQQVEDAWVLTPPQPKAVIHFLGGAFFAAAPQVAYRRLLEYLASQGYVIVATPFVNTFDHTDIARAAYRGFRKVRSKLFLDYFPTYGMGHSMGCKIHLLICSYAQPTRAGNIFLAYNNYSADRSIPFFRELSGTLPELQTLEFTPSPAETCQLVADRYTIARNLLIRFEDDGIDEILDLAEQLKTRFPKTMAVKVLPGDHLTALGLEVSWQAGEVFTPIDAIAQWVRQNLQKNHQPLEEVLCQWLTA
ncbi:MAG: DUF1350 family protein [Oscillatoriales cyanobacterium SM2_2_1]|nr:DUF1350 family protein [Oscillatoriales cyanobacterium SM2_2_1]